MLEALKISISDTKFVEYEYFADKVQSSEAETNAKYKRFLKDLSKQGPDSKMAAKKAYKKFEVITMSCCTSLMQQRQVLTFIKYAEQKTL